jgi:hypothetical protein
MKRSPSSQDLTEWVAVVAGLANLLTLESAALEQQCQKLLDEMKKKETANDQ